MEEKISRADLCLDISDLPTSELTSYIDAGQFITRANHVHPKVDRVTDRVSGFTAGRPPLRLNVYDKLLERLGKVDNLYNQALMDRRWHGKIPYSATRIEYQMWRPWLLDQGIACPADFLVRRGTLSRKLTHEWFRITAHHVDRRRKHQSRAKLHPVWLGIQDAFELVFGPAEGTLAPIRREKVKPVELAKQARGCIANCLLQMGAEIRDYYDFVSKAARVFFELFPTVEERNQFIDELERRKMEFETS